MIGALNFGKNKSMFGMMKFSIALGKTYSELTLARNYSDFTVLCRKILRHLYIVMRGIIFRYSGELMNEFVLENDLPLVSIIVPNYNHSKYLEARLDSIFKQTYKNFEVIVLDDASTDDSLRTIYEYKSRHNYDFQIISNSVNSGSGYKQWAKGIQAAKGQLVWIAESDDYSDPFFLEELIPAFSNRAVMLAFCNSIFVNEISQTKHINTGQYWYGKTNLNANKKFLISGRKFCNLGNSQSNLIPNVSSCVFRIPSPALIQGSWEQFKICGDWLFYVSLSLQGLIYHSNKNLNFYRVHEQSVITSSKRTASFMKENYEVKVAIKKILEQKSILIVIPAFVLGGGEVMAMRLAHALWKIGYPVAILNLAMLPEIDEMYKRYAGPAVYQPKNFGSFIRSSHPDFQLIHSHHASCDVIVARDKPNDTIHIISLHGMYEELSTDEVEAAELELRESISFYTYLHEKNIANFTEAFLSHNKFILVNNFVSQETRPGHSPMQSPPEGEVNVVLISRAIESKGWFEAIGAVRSARLGLNLDIHLYLVGVGPIYEELFRAQKEGWLHLCGAIMDTVNFCRSMDLGLFLSSYKGESSPLVLMEYLTAGLPTLFTKIGNSLEIVSDSDGPIGIPISSNSTELQIMEGLQSLLSLNVQDMKKIELRSIDKAKHFSEENVLQEYINIYEQALLQGS